MASPMTSERPAFGMRHLTVVPANFVPEDGARDEGDEGDEGDERRR